MIAIFFEKACVAGGYVRVGSASEQQSRRENGTENDARSRRRFCRFTTEWRAHQTKPPATQAPLKITFLDNVNEKVWNF